MKSFTGDWMASNVSEIRDEDELEMYGNERQSSVVKITSFVFEVSTCRRISRYFVMEIYSFLDLGV